MFKIITVREYNKMQADLKEKNATIDKTIAQSFELIKESKKFRDLNKSLENSLNSTRNDLGRQQEQIRYLEARVKTLSVSRGQLMERNGELNKLLKDAEKQIESLSPKQVEAIEPFAPNGDLDANLKVEPAVQEAKTVEKPKKRRYVRRNK